MEDKLIYYHTRYGRVYWVITALGLISFALLIAAFGFEYIGGLKPCKLCVWQRWSHAIIILISLLGLIGFKPQLVLGLIAFAALAGASIAGYHAGIELQLWAGPTSCSGGISSQISNADLLDNLLKTQPIRCDQIAWSFIGVSMAGWNMIITLFQAIFAAATYRKI